MKGFAPLAALALTACITVPAPATGPTAGFGQTALVGPFHVRPIALVEDSRCPANVQCVWAGRLVILAEVDFRGGSETFRGNLTLGESYRHGTEVVALVAAEPRPRAGAKIDPRAYRFTFAFGP